MLGIERSPHKQLALSLSASLPSRPKRDKRLFTNFPFNVHLCLLCRISQNAQSRNQTTTSSFRYLFSSSHLLVLSAAPPELLILSLFSNLTEVSPWERTAENCTEFDSGSQVKKSPGSSLFVRACSVAKLCLTLCRPMDCSPPASPVYRIFQARILGWVAITLSRGSSQPKDQTHNSCIAGRFFTTEPPGRPLYRAKQITSLP